MRVNPFGCRTLEIGIPQENRTIHLGVATNTLLSVSLTTSDGYRQILEMFAHLEIIKYKKKTFIQDTMPRSNKYIHSINVWI